jgi:hypothetical protein
MKMINKRYFEIKSKAKKTILGLYLLTDKPYSCLIRLYVIFRNVFLKYNRIKAKVNKNSVITKNNYKLIQYEIFHTH